MLCSDPIVGACGIHEEKNVLAICVVLAGGVVAIGVVVMV